MGIESQSERLVKGLRARIGVCAAILCVGTAWAAKVPWNTTITADGYSYDGVTATYTIDNAVLQDFGDENHQIKIYGRLTLKNGSKITIKIADEVSGDCVLRWSGSENSNGMFYIQSGCELVIEGIEGQARLILDGQCGINKPGKLDDDGYLIGPPKSTSTGHTSVQRPGILNYGSFTMTDGVIRNLANSTADKEWAGGAIQHGKFEGTGSATTRLVRTEIYACVSDLGTAIYAPKSTRGTVSMCDCLVSNCWSATESTSSGTGIVRAWGSSYVGLYMTNVTVCCNGVSLSGGGVYWKAQAECVVNGCKIFHNYAKSNGAGLCGSGVMTFAGDTPTLVYDNKAGNWGGGLYCSAGEDDLSAVTYLLPSCLKIYGNKARDGAGLAYDCSGTPNKPTILFDGVQVYGNTATSCGGGVFALGVDKLLFESGRVESNLAGNGGGLYLTNSVLTMQSGNVSSNVANRAGGGVFVGGTSKGHAAFDCPGQDGKTAVVCDNVAGQVGDDIFCSGVNTSLDLPDGVVSNGYYRLRWFEDYGDNDPKYPNLTGTGDPLNVRRFKTALAAGSPVVVTNVAADTGKLVVEGDNKYVCLALGKNFPGVVDRLSFTDTGDFGVQAIGFRFAPIFLGTPPDGTLDQWTRQMVLEDRLRAYWVSDVKDFDDEPDPSALTKVNLPEGPDAPAEGKSAWVSVDFPPDFGVVRYCKLVVVDKDDAKYGR